MQIVNARPYPLVIAVTDQRVEPGEAVEVAEALGESLLDQADNWAPAPVKKATPAKEK